jgi:competence protein ComEC
MIRLRSVACLALLLPAGFLNAAPGDNLLRVHFIDVGQGDAIWIQGPVGEGSDSGLNIVIDGGPDRNGKNRVPAYLAKYGLKKNSLIDYAIATHPHDDHYPGMLDILANYEVKTIIEPGLPKDGPKFQEFMDAAKAEKAQGKPSQFVQLRKQHDFQFPSFGDLRLRILHADITDLPDAGSKQNTIENNASVVIRMEYRNMSFLLMGDAEGKDRKDPDTVTHFVEEQLLKHPKADLQATVLKAAHHGSETGSTLRFLQAVQPDVVVVMSGRKSFAGTYLPDASTLARYKKVQPKVTIVRTDQDDEKQGLDTTNDQDGDDILIYTDGDSLQVHQSKPSSGGKRKWVKVRTVQKGPGE